MSLVAYDSSDDEKDEEFVISQPLQMIPPKNASDSSAKRRRECVKITVPSLKEFEEEESPVALKKQKLQFGSGLFSVLPPPKNTAILKKPNFVPYVLSSKKEVHQSAQPKCALKLTDTESLNAGVLNEQNNDDEATFNEESSKDTADSSCKDFFSLDGLGSNYKLDGENCLSPDSNLKTDLSSTALETSNFIQSRSSSEHLSTDMQQRNESVENPYMQSCHSPPDEVVNSEQETSSHTDHLDSSVNYSINPGTEINYGESLLKDKEFLKLQGRRREFEAIDIIDVNADDQLTDRNEWLMKSLTEESTHRPSRKKHNMPTQQQKRKHQITYLAFQAKEREMDLKNQWALNSRTRRETQAKYGF